MDETDSRPSIACARIGLFRSNWFWGLGVPFCRQFMRCTVVSIMLNGRVSGRSKLGLELTWPDRVGPGRIGLTPID
jgi:hypothetical protein